MMEAVFLKILNMGITAGWIVLAVIALRLLLKKAPKWITVLLWGLVGLRLIFPFSLESVFSLIPSAETVPADILYTDTPAIHSGVSVLNTAVNPVISDSLAPAAGASVNPMQVIAFAASIIWIAGIAGMLVYTVVSGLRIRRRVREAVPLRENILLCDHVDTPFVFGVLRPRIYLPAAMNEQDIEYVIAHEKAHLKRHDHMWKPLGFLLLTIYWFHPLLWIAYILLCRDIELACDEKVIREMGAENKKPYSDALINCSIPRRMIAACPLAFGETNVKGRVKSVLNYKKPAFWIIVVAVISCVIASICFLTDPKTSAESKNPGGVNTPFPSISGGGNYSSENFVFWMRQVYPQYFDLNTANGLDIYVWQMARNSYSFGLLPHSDVPRDWLDQDLLHLQGASAKEMRYILSTYAISENDLYIIPWQNPLSSYIADPWISDRDAAWEDEREEDRMKEKIKAYVELIENMLWGNQTAEPIYDAMAFDIDGDGKDEYCELGYAYTFSKESYFSFSISASEIGGAYLEYNDIFETELWYDLSFIKCKDGVVRVQGIEHEERSKTHLFDIVIVDGCIHLLEDGQDINKSMAYRYPVK